MFICWGAQAALYYHYGIDKHIMDHKVFGVFEHKVLRPHNPLVRGFDEIFLCAAFQTHRGAQRRYSKMSRRCGSWLIRRKWVHISFPRKTDDRSL